MRGALPRFPLLVVAFLLSTQVGSAMAGVIIGFDPDRARLPDQVLGHAEAVGVVAEFLEPGGHGLGRSTATVFWKELLFAIGDQSGAGVVLARSPEGMTMDDLRPVDYHAAAERLARSQEAELAIWGTVTALNEVVGIQLFLTLPGEASTRELALALPGLDTLGVSLSRRRYDLGFSTIDRRALRSRTVITTGRTNLRARPDGSSPVVRQIPEDTTLRTTDLVGSWFEVGRGEQHGFISAEVVRVLPREVFIDRRRVRLRDAPGRNTHIAERVRHLQGAFEVLDHAFVDGMQWFRIDHEGPRWIAMHLTEPRHVHPAVNFMAGFYRFLLGRFDVAEQEFARFLEVQERDTPLVSQALQLRGASLLLDGREGTDALALLDRASRITPYDPDAYATRALAELLSAQGLDTVLRTVNQGLDVDRASPSLRKVVRGIEVLLEAAPDPRSLEEEVLIELVAPELREDETRISRAVEETKERIRLDRRRR